MRAACTKMPEPNKPQKLPITRTLHTQNDKEETKRREKAYTVKLKTLHTHGDTDETKRRDRAYPVKLKHKK